MGGAGGRVTGNATINLVAPTVIRIQILEDEVASSSPGVLSSAEGTQAATDIQSNPRLAEDRLPIMNL
eukprot:50548-Eustigmatos_ZCMA.PRE.1